MDEPTIYFPVINSGSGVETAGHTMLSMLDDYESEHPGKVVTDSEQNPPCFVIDRILACMPDIIILNELYHRLMIPAYFYKKVRPDTKLILLNHCAINLTKQDRNAGWKKEVNNDDRILMEKCIRDEVAHIINLNYHPPDDPYSDKINAPITDMLFPIRDRFETTKPWPERSGDFFYYGGIIPLKFSEEFVDLISKTKIKISLYGRFIDKLEKTDPNYVRYKEKILSSENIDFKGYIPDDKLIETINNYRFFVTPHQGSEPFMLSLAEAIRCGCIPLVTNARTRPTDNWIDWAKGCYLEYPDTHMLIDKMWHYCNNKTRGDFVRTLEQRSMEGSQEMIRRTNYDKFKERFLEIVFSEEKCGTVVGEG